jgi:RNA polymerase sigma-70 factor (ECF subfamily)
VVLLKEARQHSDIALVAECQKGDSEAFDELVRRHKERVYNVVYRFLGHREDALDVCQEVFVRAYQSITAFRGGSQVYTWLHAIAANLAKNRIRDRKRKGRNMSSSLEALAEAAPGVAQMAERANDGRPDDIVMTRELEEVLQHCLNEMPEHYRLTFVLRTVDDLSYEEIAAVMNCPIGTVRSRLNQARRMLRDRLTELKVI